MMTNQNILITGGTGSLGQGLLKLLYPNNDIVIYSRNEENQHALRTLYKGRENIKFFIGDIRDKSTLKKALNGCTLAIHAAAMKDTIYCEQQPYQTSLNNIFGTQIFLEACLETDSLANVCGISTDKAASPSSVYGCSKYIMEKLFLEVSEYSNFKTSIVRFGNMIDSKGSLLKTWKENPQMEIKLTHEDVSRFFFTVNEASLTVLDAMKLSKNGDIFIKKMKSAKIKDILQVITKKDNFEIIGLFPGEKLHEVLVSKEESPFVVEINDYFVLNMKNNFNNNKFNYSSKNATKFELKELDELINKI